MPGINRLHYHYAKGAYNSSYKTEPVYTPILGTDLPQFMHFVELWLSSNKATGAFYVRIRLSFQQPWVDIFLHRVLRLTREWSDWRDLNSRPPDPWCQ